MKILIVSATWMEVKLITDELKYTGKKSQILKHYQLDNLKLDFLITGIGSTFTTFNLTRTLLQRSYDLVICVGIAGSLSPELRIGEVVNVTTEEFADLGIENNGEFLTLFESGFINENEPPFENGILKAAKSDGLIPLTKVHGVTINKSHGISASIEELNHKFSAHIETMEGAAVFYVCNQLNVPCYQIRAISNYLLPQEMLRWNIPLALENLKDSVLKMLRKMPVYTV